MILFSTADWDNPFWTNKQHTAVHLTERGFRVLYIESLGLRQPQLKIADLSRILNRIKKLFRGVREVRPNLFVYSPVIVPFHRFSLVRSFNDWLLQASLKYYQKKLGLKKPIIWTYNPLILKLAKSMDYQKLVYHSVDDLAAAPGVDPKTILSNEAELLQAANAVFCTSRKIEEHCKKQAHGKTYYFGNVVDYQHFSRARNARELPIEYSSIPGPRIGFIGALSSYKFDVDSVLSVARKRRDWQWVLIGKVGEGQPDSQMEALRGESNIHFLGPKSYENLPDHLAAFNVAVIPCPLNEYTQSMFPMKFFEYMAAGKPIVARNIDSLQEYLDFFYPYQDGAMLEMQISAAMERGVAYPEDSDALALENTWAKRLEKMLGVLKI